MEILFFLKGMNAGLQCQKFFSPMSATFLSMPSNIDTKNVCFSDIINSQVAKSCRNEDALAAKFSTSEMGEFIGSFAVTFFSSPSSGLGEYWA